MPSIIRTFIVHDQDSEPVSLGKVPHLVLDRRGYRNASSEDLASTLAGDLRRFEHTDHQTRLAAYRVIKTWLREEASRFESVEMPSPRQRAHAQIVENVTANVIHSWRTNYPNRQGKPPHARAFKSWQGA